MISRRLPLPAATGRAAGIGVALALVAGLVLIRAGDGYTVQVRLDSATNVVAGGPVLVDGFDSGTVESIELDDGAALVTMSLDEEVVPLHTGAEVVVGWKATLSERQIEITDGGDGASEIPDGGTLEGQMPKATEIDDVLNSLDAPTRARLQSLTGRLETTLAGSEEDLRDTITTGGPALEALGQVLRALGTDGPAIKNLVTRLDGMLGTLAARDDEVERIVERLGTLSADVAERRESLRTSLVRLPPTLTQASGTLDLVPGVVDETVPLLQDLEPATRRLGPVSRTLRPLLRDLRPLVADLRPTLASAESLLALTPGLLEASEDVLPAATSVVSGLRKPVEFMRPYTPEITAFFSTWASAFSNYDSNGNFARIFGQAGPTSFNENPGAVPPGVVYDPYPAPGAVVGQPWTDANGSEMR